MISNFIVNSKGTFQAVSKIQALVSLTALAALFSQFNAYAMDVPEEDKQVIHKSQKPTNLTFEQTKILADQGDPEAQRELALSFNVWQTIYTQTPDALAFHYYKLAADQGDVQSQYELAQAYQSGFGVAQDSVLAFHYYKLAVDQGHPEAPWRLALIYRWGVATLKKELNRKIQTLELGRETLELIEQERFGRPGTKGPKK